MSTLLAVNLSPGITQLTLFSVDPEQFPYRGRKEGRWICRTGNGGAENDKMTDMELQDMKMADKIAGHENARQEIAGRENADMKLQDT